MASPENKDDIVYFKFIETQHPLLKEYLEGFYLFHTSGGSQKIEYLVFPSNHIIISAYSGTEINIGPDQVTFVENSSCPIRATVAYALEKPVAGTYLNEIKEITFCFHPLGFNHFIEADLIHYHRTGIHSFELFEDFEVLLQQLFEEQDEEALQQKAEGYWLEKLREKDFGLLQHIVLQILDNPDRPVEEIATSSGVSRQYIGRLFERHICKTPSAFKKIARFRRTLQNRVQNLRAQKNLTKLTYESLFYDQSHLIKDFQRLTGMTPKKFFKGNKVFKNGHINWYFSE